MPSTVILFFVVPLLKESFFYFSPFPFPFYFSLFLSFLISESGLSIIFFLRGWLYSKTAARDKFLACLASFLNMFL